MPTDPRRDRGAAFFDLDRTLLAGASGTVFSEAMRESGFTSRSVPGEGLVYRLFNSIGETLPSMALARAGARMAKGRPRAAVQEAGRTAAPQLAELVQPLAASVFASHRRAGRPIVMATTSPYDLVAPLAELLGLDDVVATRYDVDADGNFTGGLTGPFVWNAGKLAAVREWADAHGIDLAASYAYSDSFYDAPLLAAVGHPYVVNPDPRMQLLAATRRWPVLDLAQTHDRSSTTTEVHDMARIPTVNPDIRTMAMSFANPLLIPYARFDIAGDEHIPRRGPAIIVANHRSYFDSAAMSLTIARTGRTIRFLGKKEVFDAPVIGPIMSAMGGIRVERGSGSDEPLNAAAEALEAGDLVAIMPQGTIPRGRAFFDPELKGRWGAARLAKMTKAPVIPIGIWGTEKVWPRSARLPNVLRVVDPPLVTVRVGPAVKLGHRSADADTKRIMTAIMDLLPAESREHREPTAAQLAATLPPGYKGDPDAETTRRPGKDG